MTTAGCCAAARRVDPDVGRLGSDVRQRGAAGPRPTCSGSGGRKTARSSRRTSGAGSTARTSGRAAPAAPAPPGRPAPQPRTRRSTAARYASASASATAAPPSYDRPQPPLLLARRRSAWRAGPGSPAPRRPCARPPAPCRPPRPPAPGTRRSARSRSGVARSGTRAYTGGHRQRRPRTGGEPVRRQVRRQGDQRVRLAPAADSRATRAASSRPAAVDVARDRLALRRRRPAPRRRRSVADRRPAAVSRGAAAPRPTASEQQQRSTRRPAADPVDRRTSGGSTRRSSRRSRSPRPRQPLSLRSQAADSAGAPTGSYDLAPERRPTSSVGVAQQRQRVRQVVAGTR